MLSDRFKTMYRQLGIDRAAAAQLLRVSERTLHNWESGKHEIPYSAYKLLRLLSFSEMPGKAWEGWHFAAGRLWSPEGYAFRPEDSQWWSALCRRASLFHVLAKENAELRERLKGGAPLRGGAPAELVAPQTGPQGLYCSVTRKVSLTDATNRDIQNTDAAGTYVPVTHKVIPRSRKDCPAIVRYNIPQNLFVKTVKGGV